MNLPELTQLIADWRIEQQPDELLRFLEDMEALGITSALEIGTGRGGLARLWREVLGWDVVAVDISASAPNAITPANADKLKRGFDLVFIDAAHDYASVSADHARYAHFATRVVAFHDIANPRSTCQGSGQYWREIKADDWHEIVGADPKPAGIGWYEVVPFEPPPPDEQPAPVKSTRKSKAKS